MTSTSYHAIPPKSVAPRLTCRHLGYGNWQARLYTPHGVYVGYGRSVGEAGYRARLQAQQETDECRR